MRRRVVALSRASRGASLKACVSTITVTPVVAGIYRAFCCINPARKLAACLLLGTEGVGFHPALPLEPGRGAACPMGPVTQTHSGETAWVGDEPGPMAAPLSRPDGHWQQRVGLPMSQVRVLAQVPHLILSSWVCSHCLLRYVSSL